MHDIWIITIQQELFTTEMQLIYDCESVMSLHLFLCNTDELLSHCITIRINVRRCRFVIMNNIILFSTKYSTVNLNYSAEDFVVWFFQMNSHCGYQTTLYQTKGKILLDTLSCLIAIWQIFLKSFFFFYLSIERCAI